MILLGSLVVLNTLQNLTLFGGMSKIQPFNRAKNPQLNLGFSSFGEQMLEKVLPKLPASKLEKVNMIYYFHKLHGIHYALYY